MVRNIIVFGGTSHPELNERICHHLGIPLAKILLDKFAVGETRVEVQESVRGKDVFIIQSGGGSINDHLVELLITISACRTASAKRVTAVLPLFPYSRQSDVPYNKAGVPLPQGQSSGSYTFESRPQTPAPHRQESQGLSGNTDTVVRKLARVKLEESPTSISKEPNGLQKAARMGNHVNGTNGFKRHDTAESTKSSQSSSKSVEFDVEKPVSIFTNHEDLVPPPIQGTDFTPQPGYKQWVAQAGTLVADLLTSAGADHVITMDLHDAQYQGFFDIPVDNLYGRPLLKRYIETDVPNYKEAIIVSPDAGGAKRATAIADKLGLQFALIHKERRPTKITDRQNATMMLVGQVAGKTAILVDDLADTSNTITRAAKLLKKEGATKVIALLTHGVLSGDAIARINASALDQVIVTNSVPQDEHKRLCPKLKSLDVSGIFAEAIRRVHHGESISVLFKYD
ncbi:MAG: ribose-phosphate pyrophosphokinase [Vezdaea aestivalis]|nr:MAG: ribose-phosphate pyrophosphokinase [Vezdaea aestivalis]